MTADLAGVEVSLTQQVLPPNDHSHGTPHAMTSRSVRVRLGNASARFEQTDYGHPGRFNPWSPRGIDAPLQARTEALLRLCDAVSALLG